MLSNQNQCYIKEVRRMLSKRIHVTLMKLEEMLSNQNSCYIKEVRRNVVQSELVFKLKKFEGILSNQNSCYI